MTADAKVLILGRHPEISTRVLETLGEAGITSKSSQTVQGAIDLAAGEPFDLLLVGGGMTVEEEREAVEGIREHLPDIRSKRRDLRRDIGPVEMVREALEAGRGR